MASTTTSAGFHCPSPDSREPVTPSGLRPIRASARRAITCCSRSLGRGFPAWPRLFGSGSRRPCSWRSSPGSAERAPVPAGARPTAPRSPWQNGHAERLIGSLRRECLDHAVVFGERHLRHMLLSYLAYYNGARTHLSLNKDAPVPRAVQAAGRIHASPILGGLHHQYVRI